MVFSEPFFLFIFLPVAIFLINLSIGRGHNYAILLFSLNFYYWSSGLAVLLLVLSIVGNWGIGLLLDRYRLKTIMAAGIVLNLLVLGFFKYAYFFAENISLMTGYEGTNPFVNIILPIGISFFTFQGVSYLIDIWRKDICAEKNLVLFGAYLSFFPQLIAGPIVRFRDVINDYRKPKITLENLALGSSRFAHGLIKKVLIADSAGLIADACFAIPANQLSTGEAWLGALAYAIQIYFDFSAYSDMAIGLGLVFGIRFLENFNHPYSSSTITEFWRRWHISLSSWFRDYLYIPLGGNRVGRLAVYRNLLIVFFITGLWHGASWSFVVWGLYHGLFLIGEKLLFGQRINALTSSWLRAVYVLPVVLIGWVIFRAENLTAATSYLQVMFNPFGGSSAGFSMTVQEVLTPYTVFALALGSTSFFASRKTTVGKFLTQQTSASMDFARLVYVTLAISFGAIIVLQSQFSPFLYFRF
jgi:alginate O-acetyltransferase complex protein AlgI